MEMLWKDFTIRPAHLQLEWYDLQNIFIATLFNKTHYRQGHYELSKESLALDRTKLHAF